jgi:hypothetical protein
MRDHEPAWRVAAHRAAEGWDAARASRDHQ